MKNSLQEIINSLRDQARDKAVLANGDEASIFAQDAKTLCKAIDLLEKLTVERDEYKLRAAAAEHDIVALLGKCTCEVRHEYCVGCNGESDDCSKCARWRGLCEENGGVLD